MGTRQDWREQLEKCHRELGFQYVRFHGLLNDEMSVVKRNQDGSLRYSFFNIDSIFDYLLSIGMKPFIELSFMPEALASGTTTCFHYKGNITPPADYDQWAELIKTLTQHLINRYGHTEVRSWFFEVWNEPNLKFFFDGTQEEYFKLYRSTCLAIKSVDSQLRVGGPATSINAWIPEIIAFCKETNTPLDFVSTHHYPTDDPLWKNGGLSIEEFFAKFADQYGSYERGVLFKMTSKAREETGDLPLYYTEWNTSAMLPDPIHDEAYSAALVAKTIADNDGLVQNYSFWTFSDLFEEGGQYAAPFHGGFGLQNIYGIPKPTYRLFEILHNLGDERLQISGESDSSVEMLAVKKASELTLLVYNHDIPGSYIQKEDVIINITGISESAAATISRIDTEHVNPKRKWIDLGSPMYPNKEQLAQIVEASRIIVEPLTIQHNDGVGTIQFTIPENGVVEIKVS
jgi:xylan 1,4-beta-xylosidase